MSLAQEARQAPVSVLLFAANVGMFLWMLAQGVDAMDPSVEALLAFGADNGYLVGHGEWWRVLTCMFLHGGLIHLAVNMYSLRILGPLAESMFGSATYFLIYAVAGAGASVASCLWNPLGFSVGASGAIFGLLGGVVAFLLTHRKAMPPEAFRAAMRNFAVVIGLDLLIGFSIPQVDNSAHLGGLVTGFVCGLAARRPSRTPPALGFARFAMLMVVAAAIAGLALLVPARVDSAMARLSPQDRADYERLLSPGPR